MRIKFSHSLIIQAVSDTIRFEIPSQTNYIKQTDYRPSCFIQASDYIAICTSIKFDCSFIFMHENITVTVTYSNCTTEDSVENLIIKNFKKITEYRLKNENIYKKLKKLYIEAQTHTSNE